MEKHLHRTERRKVNLELYVQQKYLSKMRNEKRLKLEERFLLVCISERSLCLKSSGLLENVLIIQTLGDESLT